jgi:hypothetical protein
MLKFKFNKIVTVTFNDVPATKPEKKYKNRNEREFPA